MATRREMESQTAKLLPGLIQLFGDVDHHVIKLRAKGLRMLSFSH